MKDSFKNSLMIILTMFSLIINTVGVTPALAAIDATSLAPKVDFATDTNPRQAAIGDIDGDGKLEMVTLNSSTFSVFRNTSTSGSIDASSFDAKMDFTTGSGYGVDLEIVDIDGDGQLDVVVSNQGSKTLSVFRNTSTVGSISFASRVDFGTGLMSTTAVAVGDLDGDSKPDMAAGDFNVGYVSVFRNTSAVGSISFIGPTNFGSNQGGQDTVFGDIDEDGKLDMVVASNGATSVFLNTSSGAGNVSFAARVDFAPSTWQIELSDLDGDGKLDVSGIWSGNISIYRNTSTVGSVSFASAVDFAVGTYPTSAISSDLDADGLRDLLAVYWSSHTLSVLQNTSTPGSLSFALSEDFAVGTNPPSAGTGDLDGDGMVDIVVPNHGINTVSVLRNTNTPPDTTAPDAPIVTAPPAFTNDATPIISGTAEANSWVNIWYFDGLGDPVQICQDVLVDELGDWSCVSSGVLPEREIELAVNATDDANNTSADTSRFFTVDLTAPAAPIVIEPPAFINDSTPTISGTAEANSWVNIWYFDDLGDPVQICQDVLVDELGDWSCASSQVLPEREIELAVNITDAAAHTSANASHFFIVDVTLPTVASVVRANATNPTNAASVAFTVTFSEPVTGVLANDFDLHLTGNITGASISSVAGSGATYTVAVDTGSGDGAIRVDVVDDDSIVDASNNKLAGSYQSGETYNIVKNTGADTAGVFRPGNGLLYLKNSHSSGFADVALNYGLPGDYPVVGDWDGSGDATIGVYRGGKFYLRNSNTNGFADLVFAFGQVGDQPIAGDWNGDGIDTIGVYRPSIGRFLLRDSNSAGPEDKSFYLGNAGDVGIAGDWNGDGMDTTGVFRPSNGYLFLKKTNETGIADIALNYGIPGDKPVTGDWNNDGIDTIGVYRENTFYLRNENTNGFADIVFALGNAGDMPIAGDWDGQP